MTMRSGSAPFSKYDDTLAGSSPSSGLRQVWEPSDMKVKHPLRIAIVHDWLIDFAGAERVLAEILKCFPDADLFTLIDRLPAAERAPFSAHRITTGFLQRMPGNVRHLKYYVPLMPLAIEQLDVTGYDVVISSNHVVAKGVLVSPDSLHICYIHSPMRYAWDLQFQYLREERLDCGLKGWLARLWLHRLRIWDHRSAAGVDYFVANSRFVARRVVKAYRREAVVIYPPVDTDFFQPGPERDGSYITVSRLVGYKRIDLIVEAFASMPGRRLVVIGDGPEMARISKIATANVVLMGRQPGLVMRKCLQRSRAFVFASIEDFGIAPVEAQACGIPVIALRRGGAAESVEAGDSPNPTGVFFEEQSVDAIVDAVERFEAIADTITLNACRRHAMHFSAERFRRQFSAFVEMRYRQWRDSIDDHAARRAAFDGLERSVSSDQGPSP